MNEDEKAAAKVILGEITATALDIQSSATAYLNLMKAVSERVSTEQSVNFLKMQGIGSPEMPTAEEIAAKM